MKLKVWATALALCVAFAAGYRYSAALYGADIAACARGLCDSRTGVGGEVS